MKQYHYLLMFLAIGVFSSYIADVFCYFLLDDLECYVQLVCTVWDSIEYWVAHKLFALVFYYVGFYGAFGTIVWMAEDALAIRLISKPLNWIWNVFGTVTATVIMTLICNKLAADVHFTEAFEWLYSIFN